MKTSIIEVGGLLSMDRMDRMMSDMRGMMMKGMTGPAPEKQGTGETKDIPKSDEHH